MHVVDILHHLLKENYITYNKHTTNIHKTLVLQIHPYNHAPRIFIEVQSEGADPSTIYNLRLIVKIVL
jgi:hypothetical protein